ncbi:TRAP transporter small permease [Puniceibacterium sp. IMCC21224]|uniref:TRAP transporter small permease n=1 Tax=Puniceibacterium sp. IMCC21224 TaxID=1618204 RepID=UPI00065D3C2D|nr:TRAP transporter small permease [Puniceibacterium sp. IMCC21224]KMK64970.1 TRAP-type C4-dicarboxylate transport system, small permease component [Puniceibacterium sp. IMCC21224]
MQDKDERPAKIRAGAGFLDHLGEQDKHLADEETGQIRATPEDIVALILFWATGITVFLQFFTRYALNNSLSWTEEIARYLLIAMTFIGASAVFARGEHIALTYFADRLTPGPRRWLDVAVGFCSVALLAALTYYGAQVANLMGNQPMTSIDLSTGIIYWTVTVGFAGMTLRSAIALVGRVRAHRQNGG